MNTPSNDKEEPTKSSAFENAIQLELKPADIREYMLTAFEVAQAMARTCDDPKGRLAACDLINHMYQTIAVKDFSDEAMDKTTDVQKSQLREVRNMRRKPWDYEGEADEK